MDEQTINLENFRNTSLQLPEIKSRIIKIGAHVDGLFLKGPVPWSLLCCASKHSGTTKGLNVYMSIWMLCGLNSSPTVKIQPKRIRELGISRKAFYRAIKRLEGCGLLAVSRQSGSAYTVTLLEPPNIGSEVAP